MDFPAPRPVSVRDKLDLAALSSYLRSSTRTRPVAILTIARGQRHPFVDADDLWSATDGAVDVVTIGDDQLTMAFTDLLEDRQASVYRGACRVYPPGDRWELDPRSVPLFMGRDAREAAALPRRVLNEAKRQASPVPARSTQPPRSPSPRPGATPKPQPPRPAAPQEALRNHLTTAADAAALAVHLRSSGRTRPVVVVTHATGAAAPYADIEALTRELAGLAEVYEIATAEASWALSREVPDGCQVYGGACRVYPVGTAWLEDLYLSPLRLAYSSAETEQLTRRLLSDAFTMAAATGHLMPTVAPGKPQVAEGVVAGIAGNRALVKGTGGAIVGVIWPELVDPGLPADQLFAKGMAVTGPIDPGSHRIDVRAMRRHADEVMACFVPGTTVLTSVTRVDADGCTVTLFPGVTADLPAADVALEGGDPRSVVAPGDVVAAYFAGRADNGELLLSLLDADEPATAVKSPSVLRGGPPWLRWREPERTQPAPRSVWDLADDDGAPTDELTALLREKKQLVALLYRRDAQIEALEGDLSVARGKLRQAGRKGQRVAAAVLPDEPLFEDWVDQLNFDIGLIWAFRTLPGEKASLPLAAWTCGPEFADTMTSVEGISRDKIVEVIVDVLTGRDAELTSRELHQLRTGPGGDDPYRTRADGATCWRVSLQVNTPSARRLHYWRRNDGSIELSSIRLHDDFRP